MSEQLVIESGKFYRTRNGAKAFCAVLMPINPFDGEPATFPARGYVSGRGGIDSWNLSGFFLCDTRQHELDLIAPWVDPPTPLEVCKMVRTFWTLPAHQYGGSDVTKLVTAADAAIAAAESK